MSDMAKIEKRLTMIESRLGIILGRLCEAKPDSKDEFMKVCKAKGLRGRELANEINKFHGSRDNA